MTAAQKRARAKDEYNAFLDVCPSRQLLDRISDKWVVLVLCALGGDAATGGGVATSMRYSELSRTLVGVSQKMLTQTLRSLERDGLLTRTVTPSVPVTVTYALTPLGSSLHEMSRGIRAWAQDNMAAVLEHREDHDARSGSGMNHTAVSRRRRRSARPTEQPSAVPSRPSTPTTGRSSRSSRCGRRAGGGC